MSTFVDVIGAAIPLYPVQRSMAEFNTDAHLASAGELVVLGAIAKPGSRGVEISLALDDDMMLHAQGTIDGQPYQGVVDLSPVFHALTDRLGNWHASQHGSPERAQVDDVISACGEMLIGSLLEEHDDMVVGGFLSGLSHAVHSVTKNVRKSIRKMKTPITIAAVTAATVYGGPVGGAMAAKITGPLVDAAGGSGSAKKAIAAIEEQAKDHPDLAKALSTAKKAVANTTIAYHLVDTANKARQGDKTALAQLMEVQQGADAGDLAAQQAQAIISDAMTAQDEAAPGQGATVSGATVRTQSDAERASMKVAQRRHRRTGNPIVGVVLLAEGPMMAMSFESLDDADDWFGGLAPGSIRYAAYYDANDPTWPAPVNARIGGGRSFPIPESVAMISMGEAEGLESTDTAKAELIKQVLEQDARWARIAQRAHDQKHPSAPALHNFLRGNSPLGSFAKNWEGAVQLIISTIDQLDDDTWKAAHEEFLYGLNKIVYPKARAAGFPESSFLLPDISMDDAAPAAVGHWLLPIAAGIGLGLVARWGYRKWRPTTAPTIESGETPFGRQVMSGTVVKATGKPILIPVYDEDGNATNGAAMWHPTRDQIAQFGGARPIAFVMDEDGLFLFDDPKGKPVNGGPLDGKRVAAYRPTWSVRLTDSETISAGWPDDAIEAGAAGMIARFSKTYSHKQDARYVVAEIGSEGPNSLRWLDMSPNAHEAIGMAKILAGFYPHTSTLYVFDSMHPKRKPLAILDGTKDRARVEVVSVEAA